MAGGKGAGRKRKQQAPPPAAAHDANDAASAAAKPSAQARFANWLDDQGVEWDACQLAQTERMGQGVVTTCDLAEGQVVLSVPDAAVLMPDDCCIAKELQAADLGHGGRRGSHGEALALVLAVMAERAAVSRSRHAAYIQSLPRALPGMPMFWTPAELAALAGTAAADKLAVGIRGRSGGGSSAAEWHPTPELPTAVGEAWREVVSPFVAKHAAHFRQRRRSDPNAYELYLWAMSVVAACSFELGDDGFQAMVPLWDALNHVTGECSVRLHHCEDSESLQMIAMRDVPAGAELINSYGDLGNGDLLRRFGFVEPRLNPHDCAQIPWAALWPAAATAAAAGPAGEPAADAAAAGEQPPLSDKEMKRRWRRLVNKQVAPEDGWFRIPLSGEPPPQLVRGALAAVADSSIRGSAAPEAVAAPPEDEHSAHAGNYCGHSHKQSHTHSHGGAEPKTAAAAAAAAASGGNDGGSRKGKQQNNGGGAGVGSATAEALLPPTAGDVLRLLSSLRAQRLARYPADAGAAVDPGAAAEALQQLDPGSGAWRSAAAAIVRAGELKCWAAFGQWLATPHVEASLAGMLLGQG